MNAALPLAGRHIVVTRPKSQAAHLAEAVQAAGATPVLFPVLAIEALADETPLLELASRLDDYDLACFVSPNAVEHALRPILARRRWPAPLRVACIGKSSEQALAALGIHNVIAPQGRFDSEALLELPELADMRGRRVIILRGDGGRELLGETLAARGACVDYLSCYRRSVPASDPAPLYRLWQEGRCDALTVTSSEGLRNLLTLIGKIGEAWLRRTPTFVPHARIAEQARALGLQSIILTAPADDGLLAGLIEYFRDRPAAAR